MESYITTYPLSNIIVGLKSKLLFKLVLMFLVCLFFYLLASYVYQAGKLTQESYLLAQDQKKLASLTAEKSDLSVVSNLSGLSDIEQQALAMGFVKNDNIKFLTPDMPTLAKKIK